MKDQDKTKTQLTGELAELRRRLATARRRVTELEAAEARRKRAEDALREEKEKAQQYLDIAGVVFLALDSEGHITLINKRGMEILGYREEELTGKNWFETCLPEKTRGQVRAVFKQLMQGEIEPVEYYENLVLTKSGAERIIAWHNAVLRDESGNIIGTLSSGDDVTERARAAEELRRLDQFRESIIDNANVWLNVLDEELNVVVWNKAAEEISGYSREEVVGHDKIWEWLYPDEEYRSQVVADTISIIEEGKAEHSVGTTIRCKDGQTRIISWNSQSLVDEEGNPTGSIALGRDVTERVRAEEALRRSEEAHRLLFEQSADGIIIIAKGRIARANRAFCAMYGLAVEDVIGISPLDLLHPEERDIAAQRIEAIQSGESLPESRVYRGLREDSSGFWVEVRSKRIEWEGEPALQSIVRDVTERARAEEEARRRAAQATLIYEVGQRVSGKLELDALLSEIVAGVRDAFDYHNVILFLCDEEAGRLTLQSIAGGYADVFLNGLSLPIGEGMTGYAAASGETQLSGDVSTDSHYVRKAEEITRSELSVPIKSGRKVIGVLDLQSDELDAFDESDMVAMETLSTQIAAAIENARLFEETRRRAEELAVLNELSQSLTTRLDVDQVLDEAYRGVSRLMDATNFYAALYDPDKDEVAFALDGTEGEVHKTDATRQGGKGLTEYIIHSRQPLLIRENMLERLGELGIERVGQDACSWLGAPMIVGDRVLGVMAVQSYTTPRLYDEHDRDLLVSIAGQTAIALQNAYLFEETQRRAAQLALVNDIGGQIAAVLDLDSVLERAVRLTQESFGYRHVSIFTLNQERDELVMRTRAGDFAPMFPSDHRLKLGQGMVGWVGYCGKTLLANDVDAEPHYVNLYPEVVPTRSELSVPIGVGGEVVGVLDVQSPQLDAFDANDVMVIETLADQVAVAIDNARLYGALEQELAERERVEEALQQHNRELALLNRAGRALTSTLDLDQVLAIVLEEVRRLLNVTAASVWLLEFQEDGTPGELVCWQSIGPKNEVVRGWRLAPGEGLAGYVASTGESLIVPDAYADERYFSGVDRKTGLDLRSIISVPLISKQKVIGVLQVMDTGTGRFDRADLTLVETLTASASIAVENARLYRELLGYAGQLEQRVRERTAEVQAQYARLDAVLRSTVDGIVVTDEEGSVIQANPVAQAWLTQTLSPEDAGLLREAVRSAAAQAGEQPVELLELTGLDLELSAGAVAVPEPALEVVLEEPILDEPTAVVAIHDVSHLKSLERMKTRFVTNISHELRTPITTIKLYVHLMQQRPEKWKQYLDVLAQEADHQALLVQDILQISRIDAGRLEMNPRPVPLDELADKVIAGRQALAQEHGVALERRLVETSGPVALVDLDRMEQVLNNLVENAIYYTPEGGAVVVSTGKQEAEERTWATVMVADTGMGIPEEDMPHIFDRFFRGEEPRSMQISGTGLGLAIVEEIVELHGGRVTVESKKGVGSTFTVWLPLSE